MVGMTKVILGMAHNQIPATIHLDNPISSKNGYISGAHVVSELIPWPKRGSTERAGVSALALAYERSPYP